MFALQSAAAVSAATERYGVAPGAKVLLVRERDAAIEATECGEYRVWRNVSARGRDMADFCTRLGTTAVCFCGHELHAHSKRSALAACAAAGCGCKQFRYMPVRPEEVGDSHLVRRRGFDIRTWRPLCKCKHGAAEHSPGPSGTCSLCGCAGFKAAFQCMACDRPWSEHELVVESEAERRAAGRPTGAAFFPLADNPSLQAMVFDGTHVPTGAELRVTTDAGFDVVMPAVAPGRELRPANPMRRPERSVRLSQREAGGRAPRVLALAGSAADHAASAGDAPEPLALAAPSTARDAAGAYRRGASPRGAGDRAPEPRPVAIRASAAPSRTRYAAATAAPARGHSVAADDLADPHDPWPAPPRARPLADEPVRGQGPSMGPEYTRAHRAGEVQPTRSPSAVRGSARGVPARPTDKRF